MNGFAVTKLAARGYSTETAIFSKLEEITGLIFAYVRIVLYTRESKM